MDFSFFHMQIHHSFSFLLIFEYLAERGNKTVRQSSDVRAYYWHIHLKL